MWIRILLAKIFSFMATEWKIWYLMIPSVRSRRYHFLKDPEFNFWLQKVTLMQESTINSAKNSFHIFDSVSESFARLNNIDLWNILVFCCLRCPQIASIDTLAIKNDTFDIYLSASSSLATKNLFHTLSLSYILHKHKQTAYRYRNDDHENV